MRNTLHQRIAGALGTMLIVCAAFAPATLAADVTDVGYIDQAAISSVPRFVAAGRQLKAFGDDLNRQFLARVRGVKSADVQARIAQEFKNRMAAKQQELIGPLTQRAQIAIASVASTRNLSVIVDKQIVIYGGQDITQNVIDLFNGIGDPVPPVNTPAPSSIGYVDTSQINQIPKIKQAYDDFAKFQNDQKSSFEQKMRAAKTDADRQQVAKDFQKVMDDKRKQIIDPLANQTKSVIAGVAQKRGLLLVIDRQSLIYGGTDITTDVVNGLK